MNKKIKMLFNNKLFITMFSGAIALSVSIYLIFISDSVWDYAGFLLMWFVLVLFTHAATNPKECEAWLNSEEIK